MTVIEGTGKGDGRRVALVVAKWNDFVTERLRSGALAALDAAGVNPDAVTTVRVPGAFEIPIAAQHATCGVAGRRTDRRPRRSDR